MSEHPIPAEEWEVIVRNVPLVSVDLVVRHDGGVVLGKRTNRPAEGEWFVPGGRVRKHEQRTEAVDRIAREELGVGVRIAERLGTYEHFYDEAEAELPDVGGKHYVTTGYVVDPEDDGFDPDAQHAAFETFRPPFGIDLHPYVEAFLRDAGLIE